jgi:predicted outer membrane repeat protein
VVVVPPIAAERVAVRNVSAVNGGAILGHGSDGIVLSRAA